MADSDETSNHGKTVALFFMADGTMRAAQDYVNRGRKLQNTPTEDLRGQFLASFREWANRPHDDAMNRYNSDCRAELELRSENIPYDLLEDDLDRLTKNLDEHIGNMSEDERSEAGQRMLDEYDRARGNMC